MTKTMLGGLLTWICGLLMLLALLAAIPGTEASGAKATSAEAISGPADSQNALPANES